MEAEIVCQAWTAGVRETQEFLGTNKIAVQIPMASEMVTASSLKGSCPDRFAIEWTYPGQWNLGTYGQQAILFLTRDEARGREGPWRLARGRWGVWKVESGLVNPLSDEEILFIAPETVEEISGIPSELFSDFVPAPKRSRVTGSVPQRSILIRGLSDWFNREREK